MFDMLLSLLYRLADRPLARLLARRLLLNLPRPALLRAMRFAFPQVSGGDGNEDDDDSDDDDGDDDDSDDEDEDESDDDDDADTVTLSKAELAKLQADRNEANRLKREAAERAKDERKRKRERDEQKGRWEQIAADAEKERDEALAAQQKAEDELAETARRSAIEKTAKRLNFIDPEDAHLYVSDDEADDPKSLERALKRVAKEKKNLVGSGSNRTGASVSDEDDTPTDKPKSLKDAIKAHVGS